MNSPRPETFAPTPDEAHISPRRVVNWISQAGMLACIAAGALLGTRTITSPDIGYHLAYGERFLKTGSPVDSSPEIYTLPAHASEAEEKRDKPGPGCWYDSEGRYRFPNANWLSQVIFALVHRVGGMQALSILGGLVVFGIFSASAITMRRLGLSPVWTSLGLLLIAMTAYERLNLRPELLGYLILAGQLCLLLPVALTGKGLTWPVIVAVAAGQLLLVNIHSYWLLGVGITISLLAGELLRLAWRRFLSNFLANFLSHFLSNFLSQNVSQPGFDPNLSRRAKMLAILLGIQILLAFANPWTYQLAALPIQTLIFFRQHHITTILTGSGAHPWSIIGEFYPPFYKGLDSFVGLKATLGLYFTIILSLAGIVIAIFWRKWASVFLLVGFLAVSLAMRRNIAVGAIIIVPVALAMVSLLAGKIATKIRLPRLTAVSLVAALATGLLAAALIYSVVTNRFYFDDNERRIERFGLGASLTAMPISAAAWLSENKPKGRLWTGYNISSNVYYLTQPHPQVPILTNTWAFPPRIMADVLDVTRGRAPFRKFELRYDIQAVAIKVNSFTAGGSMNPAPLVPQLLNRRNWSLVHLDALHAIFLRNVGPNAALAKRYAIQPRKMDIPAFIATLRKQDPIPAYPLQLAAVALQRFRWFTQAIEVFRAVLAEDPNYYEAWFEMGASYALRAQGKMSRGLFLGAYEDFLEARTCFQRCLEIKPDYKYAKKNLLSVGKDLQQFSR